MGDLFFLVGRDWWGGTSFFWGWMIVAIETLRRSVSIIIFVKAKTPRILRSVFALLPAAAFI